MKIQNPTNEEIRSILNKTETIAVVGLSDDPKRTSYQTSKAMQQEGFNIIPVNPRINEVLGEKSYASLKEIDRPFDVINVFRRSEFLPGIAEEAIATDCTVFWAQQGVFHEKAYKQLKENGFTVIMDSCIKVEQAVLK